MRDRATHIGLGSIGLASGVLAAAFDTPKANRFEGGQLCSAFDADNFDLNGSGSKGGVKLSTYSSSDALATIVASGYFDAQEANIATGDFIAVYSSASTGGGARLLNMVNTSGVITVGSSVSLS